MTSKLIDLLVRQTSGKKIIPFAKHLKQRSHMHKPIISPSKVCTCTAPLVLLWFLNQLRYHRIQFHIARCLSTDMLYPWEKRQNVLATGVLANLPGSSRDACSADALRQSRD